MSQTAMQKSLIDGLNEQFEKQEGSDVIFLVEETEIGAHKNVLAAQCKVLHDKASPTRADGNWNCEAVTVRHHCIDSIQHFRTLAV